MFTGIVAELGEVAAVEDLGQAARITVRGPAAAAAAGRGDSIAVNGVCLTVTEVTGATFTADVMAETLHRTALGALGPGSPVNLEQPLRLADRLGGHLVQGHVDGVGTIISRSPAEPAGGSGAIGGSGVVPGQQSGPPRAYWDLVRIAIPPRLSRYLAEKGSIAVDGVSLTVTATGGGPGETPWFEVSLVPTTLELTTLGRRRPGDPVNLEVDVIAKYVEKLAAPAGAGAGQPGTAAAAGAAGAEARS
jgi:riboflavin synthase